MTTRFEELHKTRLRVNGRDYTNWQSAEVSFGLEAAARSFSLSATVPGDGAAPIPDLYVGDAFELFVGQKRTREVKVITGFVDVVSPSYDAESSSVGVTGRSKTQDAIDCSVEGSHRFNDLRIEQIAARLCAPYGVEVVTALPPSATTGAPIPRFAADHGEKVYDAIERAARLRSLLIYDDEFGRLVLQLATPGSFPLDLGATIRRGFNVLQGSATYDGSQIFSEYRCKAQRAGTDDAFGATVAGVKATAVDMGSRKRVLVVPAESSADPKRALARVQWEAATRLGRAISVQYKVDSWFRRDAGGELGDLWQPGTKIEVVDPFLRIEADLLIVAAQLSASSEDGHTATITLAPEAGYFSELPKNPRAGLGAWRGLL
jgi:prophage tail gpP-like protein